MSKSIFINLASLLLLLALSMAHILFVANRVPPESALIINLILMPMMLGALSYFLVQGPFYVAVLILAALPIVHVIYLGGDPAKPGMERFVVMIDFFCSFALDLRLPIWADDIFPPNEASAQKRRE